jgi:hypothetical protein
MIRIERNKSFESWILQQATGFRQANRRRLASREPEDYTITMGREFERSSL